MVHGVAVDAQGRVYATDSDNQRVVVFDAQGKFLKNLPIPGRGGSFVAADGTFYISDVNSGAVAVMKNDQIVDVIKVEGRPHGMAVDPATGDVYTSSTVATRPGVTKATRRPAVPRPPTGQPAARRVFPRKTPSALLDMPQWGAYTSLH